MNSMMNITINVRAAQAQQALRATTMQTQALNTAVDRGNSRAGLGGAHMSSLAKFGNQLQWTGRMIQYNFTLPLVLAGAAATKFALDQEKAMTHVAKVYGDTTDAVNSYTEALDAGGAKAQAVRDRYAELNGESAKLSKNSEDLRTQLEGMSNAIETKELESLDRAFSALSNHYAVQKKEVMEVAGAWAAVGQSGVRLAKSVDATMTAMVLGDMSSTKATEGLIAVQAQYNLSSEELIDTLYKMNSIENATGISMQGLIDGFKRGAGNARSYGVTVNELGANLAALVPATGSAANAGNALKTIYSRLMSTTSAASDVMGLMGINVHDAGWNSLSASERLHTLANKFNDLSDAQKAHATTVIAGRWQVARFDVLTRELTSSTGYYQKALNAVEDPLKVFATAQKELNTVLDSNPKKLQRMGVMLQNSLADIIQPLIPFIIYLASELANMANAFSELNPHVQKFIVLGLAMFAMVGPLVRYMGALVTLFAVLGTGTKSIGKGFLFFGRALKAIAFGPVLLAFSGLAGVMGKFTSGLAAGASNGAKVLAGLKGIFLKWTAWSRVLWSSWSIATLAVWRGAFAAKLITASSGFFALLARFRVFYATLLVLQAGAMLAGVGRWAAFWGALKFLTVGGLAAQFVLFRNAMGLIAVTKALGAGIVGGWRLTWAAVVGINTAGWATMRAMWIAQAALGMGIWSRFRTAFVILHATMSAMVVAIWKGMAMSLLAVSRGLGAILLTGGKSILKVAVRFGRFLTGPIGIAIAAVTTLLWTFRDQIGQVFSNIGKSVQNGVGGIGGIFTSLGQLMQNVFNSLPQGVQNAMLAVVSIIREAALAVYDWFSYINPWAHHSPSLVENVTSGMARVVSQFSTLSKIKSYTGAAYAEIKKFGQLTASLQLSQKAADRAQDRKTIKDAGATQALKSYDRLLGYLNKLEPALKKIEAAMQAQQKVVDAWQAKVDQANEKLDAQQKKLNRLKDVLDEYQSKLSAAETSLSNFANMPLEGMREMENQIFANKVAQTQLRWEMMKLEDVYGTYDEIKSKLDAINGAQEVLKGTQSDLRSAGAGSEILGQYDREINKLEEQKDVYIDAARKLADMQHQLELLQREAEKLDLTKAMKFDELQYQIEMAANRMKEMPFDEIMAGIAGANAEIDKYAPKVDEASAAVAAQQAVVDNLTKARDKLADRLDKEEGKLKKIKSQYDEVKDAIDAITSALNDVVSAASKASETLGGKKGKKDKDGKLSPAAQSFMDGAGANFPDAGGKGMPLRENWLGEEGDIDAWTKKLQDKTSKAFADINPFKPLAKKAGEIWDTAKQKGAEFVGWAKGALGGIFNGVDFGDGEKFDKVLSFMKSVGSGITEVIKFVMKGVKMLWDLLGPEIIKIGKGIWNGLKSIWEQVGPELEGFIEIFPVIGQALSNIWTVVKPILAIIVGAFLGFAKVVMSIIGETIGPVLSSIGTIFKGLIRVIRGVVKIIAGIFALDFKAVWDGVVDVVTGALWAVWGVIKGAVNLIWNPIKGLVKGIYNFFYWLYDELVGHSIVPDMIDGIVACFEMLAGVAKWVWNNLVLPVWNLFKKFLKISLAVFKGFWAGIQVAWAVLKTASVWLWNNVLVPIWNVVKNIWSNFILPAFMGWWAGIQLAWAVLKTASVWLWNNVLLPIVNAVKSLWTTWVQPALAAWWEGIKLTWAVLSTVAVWLWNNVLKPIWDKVQWLWSNAVKPALAAWWLGIKTTWNVLKTVAIWLWNNVLKPIWDKVKEVWDKFVKPAFSAWWAGIKLAWSVLKTAGKWLWDNVLSPVFGKVKDVWISVKGSFEGWWEGIKKVWSSLTGLGKWVYDNVMEPVVSKIKGAWNSIKKWLGDNKDMLTAPVKGVVNVVIKAVNAIVNGLNKVADLLPGIDWKIDTIPELAQGGPIPGRRANRGFKTTGARAIVGEGKANYPEFVIPTDPTYRKRAKGLLAMAASKLGVHAAGNPGNLANSQNVGQYGVPEFGIGGWLSDRWDNVKGIGSKLKDLGVGAVKKMFKPILNLAEKGINKIKWEPPKAPPLFGIKKLRDWTDNVSTQIKDTKAKYPPPPDGGSVGVADPSNPTGRSAWKGGSFTNRFIAHMKKAEQLSNSTVKVTQGGFRPKTSYSGTSHQGDAIDMPVNTALGQAFRKVGIASGDRTGLGNWAPHIHAIPGPSAGSGAGSAVSQWSDYMAKGGANQSMSSPWGLKAGGIALKRRGPVVAALGDGRYDEAVVPLPHGWKSSGFGSGEGNTEKNYNFYGDLSFPNITSADDAKTFLENLENLAGD